MGSRFGVVPTLPWFESQSNPFLPDLVDKRCTRDNALLHQSFGQQQGMPSKMNKKLNGWVYSTASPCFYFAATLQHVNSNHPFQNNGSQAE